MDTIGTLLKLAQSRLDDVSRKAAVVAERLATLNRELIELDQGHRASDGDGDISVLIVAGDFRGRRRAEREALQGRIAEQREILDQIRGQLTVAFREKSKFEQLAAREAARAALAEAEREQKQMDEAAIRLANRR